MAAGSTAGLERAARSVLQRWFRIGGSCEPMDRRRAALAISELYRLAGRAAPLFLWRQSPRDALNHLAPLRLLSLGEPLHYAISLRTRDPLDRRLEERRSWSAEPDPAARLLSDLRRPLESSFGALLQQAVGNDNLWVWDCFWGQHDAAWVATCLFLLEHGDRRLDPRLLAPWQEVVQSCGWFWPYDRVCLVADRPARLGWDEERHVHAASGPAIRYRDGWSIHAWHGVTVPARWTARGLDVRTALRLPNQEQRRVALRVLGWERVLGELGIRGVDQDRHGTLVEVPGGLGDGEAIARFLRVTCPSTGRLYVLRVPPHVATARAAVAWTFGQDGDTYAPWLEA